MPDLTTQPEPDATACPACGGPPADAPEHRLSALGYLHDDICYTCDDCGEEWTHGVPIGTTDAGDLRCAQCDALGLVHRIHFDDGRFDVKCPECYYHWTPDRPDAPKVNVEDPRTTGATDSARPL